MTTGSSWKGVDLFGSGPHRFYLGRRGFLVLPDDSSAIPTPNMVDYGSLEWEVVIVGRLVSPTESGLWVLRDAIQASLDAKGLGTLVDLNGRSWTNLFFSRIEWAERTDRGRKMSIGYTAKFHKFNGV